MFFNVDDFSILLWGYTGQFGFFFKKEFSGQGKLKSRRF